MSENKMGVMPVKRLIVTMSLPIMISMLVQALYNVVDSIFVARLSEDALTAVTLAFPLQNLMIAVGSGTSVGVNALLSRSLGEKKFDKANQAACSGILLAFLSSMAFVVIGALGSRAFISSQIDWAEQAAQEISDMGTTYMTICSVLSIGVFFQIMNERLLQSTGRTMHSMVSQMTGAIVNIIFDPIMIFGYFGFPALGVAGAAYATVLGQCVAAVIGIFMNIRFNHDIKINMRGILKPAKGVIGRIYFVGIPSILMMSIGSVMTYLLNQILFTFESVGKTAVAVFGAYFRLQSFFFMPIFGLNNGLIPVLAYNFGARKKERIDQALRFSLILAVSFMLLGLVVFELVPELLLSMFNAEGEMLRIGVPALRIIAINFPIAAVCIIMGSIFQAFSQSYYSLVISVTRQLVILIPAAWLLAKLGDVIYVWWAFPIAEFTSLLLSLAFFSIVYKKTVLPLSEPSS